MVIVSKGSNTMWTVHIPKRVGKLIEKLPMRVKEALYVLMDDLQERGAVQGAWANYSKLGENKHHCHLKKGKPCYVVVWEVTDKEVKIIEVQYVGTHKKAPY